MLLSLLAIEKAYGPSPVLANASLILNRGDRAGLVGANGAGKSTLLRIAAADLVPDGGTVSLAAGAVAAYLPQQPPAPGEGVSLDDLLRDAVGDLRALERRLRQLEEELADGGEDGLREYGDLQEAFERRGGYDLEHRIDEVFQGLAIGQLERGRLFQTLSGGEKVRVLLAGVLLRSPDVLLLDEPTNHLDVDAIAWLEGYLACFRGAMLVVSHDRRFLDAIATRVCEVDEHTHELRQYAGNYSSYAAARAKERARAAEEYARQQDEIAALRRTVRVEAREVGQSGRAPRDNDKFAKGFFGGRHDVAVARTVRAPQEKLRRIQADPLPKPPEVLRIAPEFVLEGLGSRFALHVEAVSKALDGRPVLADVSFELGARARVVITGANGAGKSTLLDILAGRRQPDAGRVRWTNGARVGYVDQDAAELDQSRTLLDLYRAGLTGFRDEHIRDLLRYGLFEMEDVSKPAAKLSTGERRKLQLARLVATKANALLLDEPTNHLAFDIVEQFERALVSFPGPVIAVSHDRLFIERFGGEVWQLSGGRLGAA